MLVVGCGHEKSQTVMAWLARVVCGLVLGCFGQRRNVRGVFFGESRCGGLDPSWGTTKGSEQQSIREFGHGDVLMLCFVIQDGDKEPGDCR